MVLLYTTSGLQKIINQEIKKQGNMTYNLEEKPQKHTLFTLWLFAVKACQSLI